MKLPVPAFLRDQNAVRAFERQEPEFRRLVFYSEGSGDWPHIGPVVQELLASTDAKISYLTSDASDPGLSIEDERIRAFNVGDGTARTILFARIDCGAFVMTLPDLGNLWLKRSVHPVRYVYLFHSFNSTHTSYRTGAFDNFDSVLCVGPHHVREIRRTEEEYGLPAKELVEHGSAKLDTLLEEVGDGVPPSDDGAAGAPRVLVAPTWGESSLIESPVGDAVLDALVEAGLPTVIRFHPMTTRRLPERVEEIRRRYASHPTFRIETEMSATASWLASDVMVSDWSGAATEYAFALGRPVLYVDTPPKIMNPEWQRIGLPAFEDEIRPKLGRVVDPSSVADIPRFAAEVTADPESNQSRASAARSESVFNVGRSSAAAATFLSELEAVR